VEWYGARGSVRDLETLTLDDFAALTGERFRVGTSELELIEVNEIAREPGGRAPFALVFRGGPTPALPQGIRRVEHESLGALDLFLVPVAADRYEAVFT
jgi:hypothetical protein